VKVSRRHGRLRLRLEPVETALLAKLIDELDTLMAEPVADDEVLRRLYPPAYRGDDEAEVEFRSLTESGLRAERSDRMAACRADLVDAGDIDLGDEDAARRWIQVLNDLRLALGTRLGVTEEDEPDLDPGGPDTHPRVVYHWLTALQDRVVTGLMR
jgi:Domain of unknown function (DUF2017)